MASHVDSWSVAAQRLGVTVKVPLRVTLPDGSQLEAQMHVLGFGAERGTLVFSNSDALNGFEELLISSGYAYSVFDEPRQGDVTPEGDMIEILNDWGWCGPENQRPQWVT